MMIAPNARRAGLLLAAAALAAIGLPNARERRRLDRRIDGVAASLRSRPRCLNRPDILAARTTPTRHARLASWQTIGGCGAGAATGPGGGAKWIGRGVSGGWFQIQCQTHLVYIGEGRRDVASTLQLTRELSERWAAGLSVPYLYKAQDRFPRPDLKLANRGLGDLNLTASRRFGVLGQTVMSLWIGLPTGTHAARWQVNTQAAPLPNDLQLGVGRPTASVVVDHTIDRTWGLMLLGASANHRGGRNSLGNHRAPNANVYVHAGYVLGAFVPALGVTLTGALEHDESLGQPVDSPRLAVALNGSIEWASDWLAILVGASLPYGKRAAGIGREPWVLSAGVSLSPF
jgi:hypothetical protein